MQITQAGLMVRTRLEATLKESPTLAAATQTEAMAVIPIRKT